MFGAPPSSFPSVVGRFQVVVFGVVLVVVLSVDRNAWWASFGRLVGGGASGVDGGCLCPWRLLPDLLAPVVVRIVCMW